MLEQKGEQCQKRVYDVSGLFGMARPQSVLESTLLITGVSNLPGIMQLHHHWSSHTKHAKPNISVPSDQLLLQTQSMMTQAKCNSACQATGGLL